MKTTMLNSLFFIASCSAGIMYIPKSANQEKGPSFTKSPEHPSLVSDASEYNERRSDGYRMPGPHSDAEHSGEPGEADSDDKIGKEALPKSDGEESVPSKIYDTDHNSSRDQDKAHPMKERHSQNHQQIGSYKDEYESSDVNTKETCAESKIEHTRSEVDAAYNEILDAGESSGPLATHKHGDDYESHKVARSLYQQKDIHDDDGYGPHYDKKPEDKKSKAGSRPKENDQHEKDSQYQKNDNDYKGSRKSKNVEKPNNNGSTGKEHDTNREYADRNEAKNHSNDYKQNQGHGPVSKNTKKPSSEVKSAKGDIYNENRLKDDYKPNTDGGLHEEKKHSYKSDSSHPNTSNGKENIGNISKNPKLEGYRALSEGKGSAHSRSDTKMKEKESAIVSDEYEPENMRNQKIQHDSQEKHKSEGDKKTDHKNNDDNYENNAKINQHSSKVSANTGDKPDYAHESKKVGGKSADNNNSYRKSLDTHKPKDARITQKAKSKDSNDARHNDDLAKGQQVKPHGYKAGDMKSLKDSELYEEKDQKAVEKDSYDEESDMASYKNDEEEDSADESEDTEDESEDDSDDESAEESEDQDEDDAENKESGEDGKDEDEE